MYIIRFDLSPSFQEGFNARGKSAVSGRARLGLVANQENNCDSPDSFVGFGTRYTHKQARNSAGNYAASSYRPDNGAANIKAIGYIMAR